MLTQTASIHLDHPHTRAAEAEAALAATKEKLKLTVRKGRALEKERDQLRAELAERNAQQAAVRSRPLCETCILISHVHLENECSPFSICLYVVGLRLRHTKQQALEPSHQMLAHALWRETAAGSQPCKGQLTTVTCGGLFRGSATSGGHEPRVASERTDCMQVSNGDVEHDAGSARGTAADAAAAEEGAGDDLNQQLAAAQARLVEAAEVTLQQYTVI